jgi:predicted dehydrogenase
VIRFGTLGAARITPAALINPCRNIDDAVVSVVAARDRARAEAFAQEHGIPNVVDSYEDVINHPDIDAVYNPLHTGLHHEWSIKALEAGKHVLCEKAIANNAREAEEMAAVARATGLVLMDAYHYRYHPCFIRAKEICDSGVLGEISEIDGTFHVAGHLEGDIRTNYETGGGATMDIGCYPISWVRHISGEEPVEVTAIAETGNANVDLYLAADLTFPSGIVGHISGDMRNGGKPRADLTVKGSKGTLSIWNPIAPQHGCKFDVTIGGVTTRETIEKRASYDYQLDAFIAAIEQGDSLYTDADEAVNQMKAIDACYEAAGLPLRGL